MGPALLGLCLISLSLPARAELPSPDPAPLAVQAQLSLPANADLRSFYERRGDRPLWTAGGVLSPAALDALALIRTADLDGVSPDEIGSPALALAIRQAQSSPSPGALAAAELALSRSFSAYVRRTLEAPEGGMLYEHVSLEPQVPTEARALEAAAGAPSLDEYVHRMAWLHPLYASLRRAYIAAGEQDDATRSAVIANLARIRALPAVPPGGRYVLVNAAAARLWMYEGDRPVDSMKVVVGKVDHQTPIMSGYIRYAIINPYWNVPADFARDKIAGQVLAHGTAYLRRQGYQVLSDWTPEAVVADPATVNWKAVAQGSELLRVRQLPGPANSMGQVKFEFPNQLGIYLHDTPQTQLMQEAARQFSSGCVRLEDAPRLGRWLFGGEMPQGSATEERFDLPQLVPVYITYLTVAPENGTLAMIGDPYGRDRSAQPALAIEAVGMVASR